MCSWRCGNPPGCVARWAAQPITPVKGSSLSGSQPTSDGRLVFCRVKCTWSPGARPLSIWDPSGSKAMVIASIRPGMSPCSIKIRLISGATTRTMPWADQCPAIDGRSERPCPLATTSRRSLPTSCAHQSDPSKKPDTHRQVHEHDHFVQAHVESSGSDQCTWRSGGGASSFSCWNSLDSSSSAGFSPQPIPSSGIQRPRRYPWRSTRNSMWRRQRRIRPGEFWAQAAAEQVIGRRGSRTIRRGSRKGERQVTHRIV